MSSISMPLVTIYITNWNYGKFIEKAVESVLAQTFTDIELIIIDDGSSDNSREVISKYENHPKIRIILQENKGLNRSCNIALKASRGKYIMRLDADDFLDPQALLVMVHVIESNPDLGLVFPDYYYTDEEGDIIAQEKRHDFRNGVSLLDQPAHGACTLIRKSSLIGVGGYTEGLRCQDGYDLWVRFIEKHEVQNVGLPLFYYRKHGNNLTENNEIIIQTRAKIKKIHADRLKKKPIETVAIIPSRGKCVDPGCLALDTLGEKTLLDWTIEAALKAESVTATVVTTPDREILEHVSKTYGSSVETILRPTAMARENAVLFDTVEHALLNCSFNNDSMSVLLLSQETPFRSAMYIDKAINTMRIFDVDSVIPVLAEEDLFFQHNGHGLQLIGKDANPGLRFEREYIYRKVRGLSLVTGSFFRKHKKEFGGKVGHVVFTEQDAITVRNSRDLELANFIFNKRTQ